MSLHDHLRDTAEELRSLAADLVSRAERLDAAAAEIDSKSSSAPAAPVPLIHTDSDEEAAARLIALEAASSGRDRDDLLRQLKSDFPSVDAEALVQRFYT